MQVLSFFRLSDVWCSSNSSFLENARGLSGCVVRTAGTPVDYSLIYKKKIKIQCPEEIRKDISNS